MAQEAFLGEIRHFSFGYAPKNWAQCNGQLIPIKQNQALFSLLGTSFGGDGVNTFGLPNMQGRVPLSSGPLSGGQQYTYAQPGGAASVQLTTAQMPSHIHQANGSASTAASNAPNANVLPGTFQSDAIYSNSGASVVYMGTSTVGNTGNNVGHENRQPFLALNVCICVVGIYPPRS